MRSKVLIVCLGFLITLFLSGCTGFKAKAKKLIEPWTRDYYAERLKKQEEAVKKDRAYMEYLSKKRAGIEDATPPEITCEDARLILDHYVENKKLLLRFRNSPLARLSSQRQGLVLQLKAADINIARVLKLYSHCFSKEDRERALKWLRARGY